MNRETLAEVICNLEGNDPNNETHWEAALLSADERLVYVAERLEYLRGQIEAESISYEEIAELQGLAEFIEPGDVQLLEWAGVPESEGYCSKCGEPTDELGSGALCAFHRDHPEEV